MPIDASIPLQVRRPQLMNQGDVLALRDLMQRYQMGGIELQNAQQAQKDDAAVRAILGGSQPGPTGQPTPQTLQQITAAAPQVGLKMSGQVQQQQLLSTQIGANQAAINERADKLQERKASVLNSVKESAVAAYDLAKKAAGPGGSDFAAKQAYENTFRAGMREKDNQGLLSGLYGSEEEHQNMLNHVLPIEYARAQVTPLKDIASQQKEDESAATRKRQLEMEGERLKLERRRVDIAEKQADVAPLDSDTLEMDAYRYLTDGTLPPNMGRGNQGSAQAKEIRARAAQLAKDTGLSADEIRISQLTNKAQVGAILQLGKARAQILQFERTAEANADLALEASRKVWRAGSPMANQPLNALRQHASGDPEFAKFNAANETFISEYAKVMSGGYGAASTTEGAQARAHQLLNTAMNQPQYEAVVGQLRKEMTNRKNALDDQMEDEKLRLRGQKKPERPSDSPMPMPDRSQWSNMRKGQLYSMPNGSKATFTGQFSDRGNPMMEDASSAPQPVQPKKGPEPGTVVEGASGRFRFKGGDPNVRENWEKQ